jgi:tetratricopeptide (TPR) repeat protein
VRAGRQEQAIKMGEAALKYVPNAAALWFNVANVYGKLERWEDSEKAFLKAIGLSNREARFHLNLGNNTLFNNMLFGQRLLGQGCE